MFVGKHHVSRVGGLGGVGRSGRRGSGTKANMMFAHKQTEPTQRGGPLPGFPKKKAFTNKRLADPTGQRAVCLSANIMLAEWAHWERWVALGGVGRTPRLT